MTDNEIIKGLDSLPHNIVICSKVNTGGEFNAEIESITAITIGDVLDLINRQKAELENYSHNIRKMTSSIREYQKALEQAKAENKKNENIIRLADKTIATANAEIDSLNKTLVFEINSAFERGKAEAYKEFVERLHEELRMYGTKDKFNKAVFLNVVDKAKKEMVDE